MSRHRRLLLAVCLVALTCVVLVAAAQQAGAHSGASFCLALPLIVLGVLPVLRVPGWIGDMRANRVEVATAQPFLFQLPPPFFF